VGSLGAVSNALTAAKRHAEATVVAHEGLMKIAPFVERYPHAFDEPIRALAQDYLSACEKSGTEPDQALLAQVLASGTVQ
jgi:hypothetical protein